MNSVDLKKRLLWAILITTLAINWCPSQCWADADAIMPSDLKYSDPFEVKSRIMEIDYGNNMVIIAEKKVYVVDLMIGSQSLKTALSDADGEAILFDSLDRGQTVMVRGMKLPDGRVIAGELVRLSDSY